MTRAGLTTLALAAVMLATTGCGGSKSLSHAELIAKADPICRRANEKLNSSKIDPQNLSSIAPGIAAVEQRVSVELDKLTPPTSMASDWKAIVDGWKTAGEGLAKVGEAAKAKDSNALLKSNAQFTNVQHRRAVTASRNGFNDCAKY